jgi:hypothetical protein
MATCNDLIESAIANKDELHPSSEHYIISIMIDDATRLGGAMASWLKADHEWERLPAEAAIKAARRKWADMTCRMLTTVRKREAEAVADVD